MAQINNNLLKHAFALFSLIPLIILIAVVLAEKSATNSDNATAEKDIQRMEKLQKAKEYVDKLNEAQNYWTAVVRENFVIMDRKPLKKMANGPIETPKQQQNKTQQRKANESTITLPSKFDAREKWPECADFIGMVTHKGFNGSVSCGAGWAHSAAAVLTDRICIERLKKGIRSYTNHASSFASVQDTMESQSCDCTNGNNAPAAWRWFAETGVVTGTNYSMGLGCKPYIYPPEKNLPVKPIGCRMQCDKQLPFNYRKGKVFKLKGAPTHWEGTDENREEEMMREIMTNGPIQATVDGYYDLLNYGKSSKRINVYVHTNEKSVFAHSLKLIGWGEQTTDKGELVKYWNGVNSFGTDWGLNGLFKWRRGTDECRIESFDINFGTPDV